MRGGLAASALTRAHMPEGLRGVCEAENSFLLRALIRKLIPHFFGIFFPLAGETRRASADDAADDRLMMTVARCSLNLTIGRILVTCSCFYNEIQKNQKAFLSTTENITHLVAERRNDDRLESRDGEVRAAPAPLTVNRNPNRTVR